LLYDKTTQTALPQKTTLALAFVMMMNYLAILLYPFIVDFFQWVFHTQSQEFPRDGHAKIGFQFLILHFLFQLVVKQKGMTAPICPDDDELPGYFALSLYRRFFPVGIPYPIARVSVYL